MNQTSTAVIPPSPRNAIIITFNQDSLRFFVSTSLKPPSLNGVSRGIPCADTCLALTSDRYRLPGISLLDGSCDRTAGL